MQITRQTNRRGRTGRTAIAPALALCLALGSVLALTLVAGSTPAEAQVGVPVPTLCPRIIDPIPTGMTVRPNASYNNPRPEYKFVHSGTHLQGRRSGEKFAAGLLWNPPVPRELSGVQSVVVVTNPNQVPAAVTVEFYDEGGVMVGNVALNIPPEGFQTVPASSLVAGFPSGRGSARIVSTDDAPIVGEVIHHMQWMDLGGFGGPILTDPDPFNPGAASVQQLQVRQENKTALYFGPMPVSDQSNLDFMNGNAPAIWVMNPNPTPTTVSIGVFSRLGINFGTAVVTLPAFASTIDLRLWNALWGPYIAGPINYDDDFVVAAFADQPIIGEVVMTDMFANGFGSNLQLGARFRMGSAMMANSPSIRLIDPELTVELTDPGVDTMIGITNAFPQDIGPVTIEYRDRNGVVLGTNTIASFPQAAMARIGRGQPQSSNFPAGPVFDGSVRITACAAGLLGWTMRTSGDIPGVTSTGFKKVWGEALAGANGAEPGAGFQVNIGGQNWIRKVSPIVRVDPSFYWPGYTNFVNLSVGNIGPYWYRFHTAAGTNVTRLAGQPFGGVQFGDTSFTYEDLWVDPFQIFFATNLSGRVDHTTGRIEGIHVLGDPLVEWGIFTSSPDGGGVEGVTSGQ